MRTAFYTVFCILSYLSSTVGWGLEVHNWWWAGTGYFIIILLGFISDCNE